jgi:hypothetical protein
VYVEVLYAAAQASCRYLCPPTPNNLQYVASLYIPLDWLVVVALMLCWSIIHPLAAQVRVRDLLGDVVVMLRWSVVHPLALAAQ